MIAILRSPGTLELTTLIPRKVKVADLNGNARLPDTLWHSELDPEAGKWLGLSVEGRLMYAWSEKGKIEVWGLPEGGVDCKEEEPVWTFRAAGQVDVPGGMAVSVVRLQPYTDAGVPGTITLAVGYTTEGGEVEVFEASTAAGKKSPSTKSPALKLISLFKSKPPGADSLKLAIPGGVTSICWLPLPTPAATTTQTVVAPGANRYARNKPSEPKGSLFLATGTATGELRLYDTQHSRRPIFREELLPRGGAAALRRGVGTNVTRAVGGAGTGAVKCLQFINPPQESEAASDPTSLSFIFSDENAKCGIYVAKRTSAGEKEWKGRATQLLAGDITGIVRGVGLYHHHSPKDETNGILIALVGLDRYLRVYRGIADVAAGGGVERVEMVSRAYMNTRGMHVVWVDRVDDLLWETEAGRKEREREERRKVREKEVEEVWEGIDGVEVDGDETMQDDEEEGEEAEDGDEVAESEEDEGISDEEEDEEDEEEDELDDSDDSAEEDEAVVSPPPPSKLRVTRSGSASAAISKQNVMPTPARGGGKTRAKR